MRRLFLVGFFLMTSQGPASLASSNASASRSPSNVFIVEDPSNHQHLLRIEEHSATHGNDLVQERQFKDLSNVLAGAETVRFTESSLQLQTYRFEDLATGERSELKIDGDKAVAQYRATKTDAIKSSALPWGPRALTGNLLPALILKDWNALSDNGTVEFDLFVPFRLETIAFRLTRQDHPDKTATVVAEARNWLIRQFAPAISFEFSGDSPPRLLKYRGPAPVQIGNEKVKAVEINFRAAPLAFQG